MFTMSKWEAFRECASAYQDRINGIQIRSAEWKEQEAVETGTVDWGYGRLSRIGGLCV